MKKVIVIVGPTASGKTSLSIRLAKALQTEVINGDAVQIYKRLDIGSAKITQEEMKGVKHHLLDIADPSQTYSVFQYQKDVREKIKDIEIPLIVGGTGLYIKAALYDYEFDEVDIEKDFEKQYEQTHTFELYQMLKALDPHTHVDQKNRRRVLRALALAEKGIKQSEKNRKNVCLYDPLIIYLDIDRTILEQRLVTRLEKQLEDGFIDEVRSLSQDGIEINAIGYRALASYVRNEISLDEAKQIIIKKSKALAKKQKTWFKNQMNVTMFDALSDSLYEDVFTLVNDFLKS